MGEIHREYPAYSKPDHLLNWEHQNTELVEAVVSFIEHLREPVGGNVGGEITLIEEQVEFIRAVLGPVNPDTGLRLVTEALLTLARKNGKTALIAGLTLAMLSLREFGPLINQELLVGAADREQAGILYKQVSGFILLDRDLGLRDLFHTVPSKKTIINKRTNSQLIVMSSDAYRAHGRNPYMVILDEFGNIPSERAREFYGVMTSGFGAQREYLTVIISTQAPQDSHPMSETVDMAKRCNLGEVTNNEFAGFVFEIPEEKDVFDPQNWYLANPAIDKFRSRRDMETLAKKAKEIPARENAFRALNCNQRRNMVTPFITRDLWLGCEGEIDVPALSGRRCYAGLDLSSKRDLTGLSLVFEDDDDKRVPTLNFAWLPSKGLADKSIEDKVPYETWSDQGYLDTGAETVIDYDRVARKLGELLEIYNIQGLAFDRWKISDFKAAMRRVGLDEYADDEQWMIPIGQGYKDAPACISALEVAIYEKRLLHDGNPVLTWCVSNAVIATDESQNRKWQKSKSYGRIDLVVSLSMALRLKEMREQEEEVELGGVMFV